MQRMAAAFEALPITVADGNIQFLMDDFNVYLPFYQTKRWLETEDLFDSTRLEADTRERKEAVSGISAKAEAAGSSKRLVKQKPSRCLEEGLLNCGNFLRSVQSRVYPPCCSGGGGGGERPALVCVRFGQDMRTQCARAGPN